MGISVPATRINGAAAQTADGDGFTHRSVGLSLATLGWLAAILAFVISVTTAGAVASGASASRVAALDALSFGIAIAALGTGKTGIALALWGIVRRIRRRAKSMEATLPELVAASQGVRKRSARDRAHRPGPGPGSHQRRPVRSSFTTWPG